MMITMGADIADCQRRALQRVRAAIQAVVLAGVVRMHPMRLSSGR
jgi:hypothetical protein